MSFETSVLLLLSLHSLAHMLAYHLLQKMHKEIVALKAREVSDA